MNNITIRQYSVEDWPHCDHLINSEVCLPETFYSIMKCRPEGEIIENYIVAEDNDKNIIGFCGYTQDCEVDDVFWLAWFGIKREFQRHGIGTKLVKNLLEALQSHNARLLLVHTSSKLEGAQHFYDKLGFTLQGRIKNYFRTGEDKLIYSKSLL